MQGYLRFQRLFLNDLSDVSVKPVPVKLSNDTLAE